MALDRSKTFYSRTKPTPLAAGVEIKDEGLVLVSVLENGIEKAKPSVGGSNTEVILGFSTDTSLRGTTRVEVETAKVPSSAAYTVNLANVLLVSNSLRVVNTANNTALTVVTAAPNAGEVQVNYQTGLLTFNAAQQGIDILVTYRRTLSAAEIPFTVRSANVNAGGQGIVENISVARGDGEIFTDMFDTAADYSNVTKLYAGANGIITSVQGSNTEIPGSRLIQAPSASELGDLRIGATIGFAYNLA